jgi:hypothetical protein
MFERPDQISSPLYVVSMLFNPVRYRSRWKLFERFARHVEESGAILYTGEVAFGERAFAIQGRDPSRHFQWRTSGELWLKENALNLLAARLPPDWRYVAWIDADVAFSRPDWANETLHQLQHFGLVQMWTHGIDLNSRHEPIAHSSGYAWCLRHEGRRGVPSLAAARGGSSGNYYYVPPAGPPSRPAHWFWHPGYAWACRREVWDATGGLIDWALLGSADRFMADASAYRLQHPWPNYTHETERRWLLEWQQRLQETLRGNVGYVSGTISHYWHGPKAARQYNERGQILIETRFDPERDLVRDGQGLYKLRGNKPALRDRLQSYFRARQEDQL